MDRINAAWAGTSKIYSKERVLTSRDPDAQTLMENLKLQGTEAGFEKWQLPVFFEKSGGDGEGGAQFFITRGDSHAKVSPHAHDNGDAIRYIVSGSVLYEDQELVAGDWMFIPRDVPYSIEMGPFGAVMCYCYQCCCVPV